MTTTTTTPAVATRTDPTFRRGRHLALAVIGLSHGPLTGETAGVLLAATSSPTWSAELSTANAAVALCFAAFVAWLAFAVFDTHAEVTILPRRWRDLGGLLAV